MPTFPALNGQVKTPLRFYPEERMTSWNRTPCHDLFANCPWALPTLLESLPPFQFWKQPGSPTITSWKIYDVFTGTEQADITADASLIAHEQFEGIDYWIYSGSDLSVPIPSLSSADNALYSVIVFSDGATYYSELFRPTCEDATIGEDAFEWDFATQGLVGWGVGSSDNEADDTWAVAGTPGTADPFEGMVVINTSDNEVYTYIGGAWNAGAVPSNGDYCLVKSTGQWLCYNCVEPFPDGWETMVDPPFSISSEGVCRSGPNPDLLGLFYEGITFGSGSVTLVVEITESGHGNLHINLGTEDLGTISAAGEHTFTVTPGAEGSIEFTTGGGWDGCIVDIRIGNPARTTLCNLMLEWTNCGNVGGLYYESGFVNRMLLDRNVEIVRPTPILNTENTENGRKDQLQDFFRKEVEYKIPMGLVPWHIADALSEIGGHDTITLTQKFGFGTDQIKRVRVVQTWPETGDDCLANVDLFFQVEEETVVSSCCDVFDPPCDPDLEPGEITSQECFEDDCDEGYVFTADIPEGYRGELMVSVDGGTNYTTTDLDLTAAEWAANELPVDPVPGLYLILVYFADCEVGATEAVLFSCPAMRQCDFWQDFRQGSEAQTDYKITSFIVDAVEQLAASIPFPTPLNVDVVNGSDFVTNMIDAMNSAEVECFVFEPSPLNDSETGSDGFEHGGLLRVRYPLASTFTIIIQSSLSTNAYRYSDTAAEKWNGSAWVALDFPYVAGTFEAPENCEDL